MKFLTLIIAIGFALPASADFTVTDDANVFGKLRTWFSPQSFEKTMACGQTSTVDATAKSCELLCDGAWCRSKCEQYNTPSGKGRYDLHTDDCSADLTHVYGDNGLIVPVTRQDFEAGAGTFLLPFLRAMGQYIQPEGEVHLTWMWPTSTEYIDNGNLIRLNAYIVDGDIRYPQATQPQRFRVVLTDQLTGPKQILLFQLDKDDVFMKTRGLVGEFLP